MSVKIKKHAKAVITQQEMVKGEVIAEDIQQEVVKQPGAGKPLTEHVCEVGVESSYTHNLGNYKSARVQVSLKVPCRHGEIDEVYDYAEHWVEARMTKLVEELTEQ